MAAIDHDDLGVRIGDQGIREGHARGAASDDE
jgi:hypothetical protein